MTVGQPELNIINTFLNASFPYESDKGELYTFGGATVRDGKSLLCTELLTGFQTLLTYYILMVLNTKDFNQHLKQIFTM